MKPPKQPRRYRAARVAARPYPRELEQRIELHGISVLLRPIRATDTRAYLQFISSSDAADVRLRFRTLACKDLARYTRSIDYDRDMAFVATAAETGGAFAILGEVHIFTYPDGATAEFALLIRTDMQRRGLGRVLLVKAIKYCRSRGHRVLIGQISPENQPMIALARRCGMEVELAPGSNLAIAHLDLQPNHPAPAHPML